MNGLTDGPLVRLCTSSHTVQENAGAGKPMTLLDGRGNRDCRAQRRPVGAALTDARLHADDPHSCFRGTSERPS